MRKTMSLGLGVLVVGVAALLAFSPIELNSQQSASVSIDQDDIGGVVTSAEVKTERANTKRTEGAAH